MKMVPITEQDFRLDMLYNMLVNQRIKACRTRFTPERDMAVFIYETQNKKRTG